MSKYPDLNGVWNSQEDSDSSSDTDTENETNEDEMNAQLLQKYRYDEYGMLVCGDQPPAPQTPTAPKPSGSQTDHVHFAELPEGIKPTTVGQPAAATAAATAFGHKLKAKHPAYRHLVLKRGPAGKLGIKLRRMGNCIYFSFVDKSSNAAKDGIGFGDQLVEMKGVHMPSMTGRKLMNLIQASRATDFKVVVAHRPYDFDIVGFVSDKGELLYKTQQGRHLGEIKWQKVMTTGCIKHLLVLAVNNRQLLGLRETEIYGILSGIQGQVTLRVMPKVLVNHLMKHQDKEKARTTLQLSNQPK